MFSLELMVDSPQRIQTASCGRVTPLRPPSRGELQAEVFLKKLVNRLHALNSPNIYA